MEFKEKLAELAKIAQSSEAQIEKHKKIWIEEVNNLYQSITDWFKEYIDLKQIDIAFYPLEEVEYEEFFEKIQIMNLKLGGSLGDSVVVLEPTGINVIGALGKIDLYFSGHRDERVFLLLIDDQDEKRHWKLWKNRKEQETFSKDTFEKLLSEWIDKWAIKEIEGR